MTDEGIEIRWAPRVRQQDIRRLYETDARGIYDEELIDKVGWGLYIRCESFIVAVEAARGRVKCSRCGETIPHHGAPDEVLHCAGCGWEMPWSTYFRSFQHKQLSGAEPVLGFFREFLARFPVASNPREKMVLIDTLIHGFHQSLLGDPTRTTAVNLIEGRYHEVVGFLDSLTYGEGSTPGMRQRLAEWREKIDHTAEEWGDARLKRLKQLRNERPSSG